MSEIIEVPAALIMRVANPNIEVFISSNSKGNPYKVGDSEILKNSGLYCERVINTQEKLIIPDALKNSEWCNNPDIKLNMISYLGFPIKLPNNEPFGTLCVLDNKPNGYTKTVESLMIKFKDLIETQIENLYVNQKLGDKNRRLSDYLHEVQNFRGGMTICSYCKNIKDKDDNWHNIEKYLIKHPEADFSHSICPKCFKKEYPDIDIDV